MRSVYPGDIRISSSPESVDPVIPEFGRMIFLDMKSSNSWYDSNSTVSAEPSDPSFMPNLNGDVYEFDGSNDLLIIDDKNYTSISRGHVFIAAKTSDKSQRQTLLSMRHPTNTAADDFEYKIGIREASSGTDGKLDALIYNTTNTNSTLIASTAVTDNEYFLAEFELEPKGNLYLRLNGVQVASGACEVIETSAKSIGNVLYIGGTPGVSRNLNGEIAFIAIYSRSLTAAERNQVYTYAENWVASITDA